MRHQDRLELHGNPAKTPGALAAKSVLVKRSAFAAAKLTDQEVSEIRAIAVKVNGAGAFLNSAIRNYANQKVKRRPLPQIRDANTASAG